MENSSGYSHNYIEWALRMWLLRVKEIIFNNIPVLCKSLLRYPSALFNWCIICNWSDGNSITASPTKDVSVFHPVAYSKVYVPTPAITNQFCLKGKSHPPILLHCYYSSVSDAVDCIPGVVCDKVSVASTSPLSPPHLGLLHFNISQNAFQQWGCTLVAFSLKRVCERINCCCV